LQEKTSISRLALAECAPWCVRAAPIGTLLQYSIPSGQPQAFWHDCRFVPYIGIYNPVNAKEPEKEIRRLKPSRKGLKERGLRYSST
jgi:hypothetical protein